MADNEAKSPAADPLGDGKPEGHVNLSRFGRQLIKNALGTKRGQFVIDLVEHLTPEDIEKMAGKAGWAASVLRGRI
jgi:hypothetical protein